MKIIAAYSHKGGEEYIRMHYPGELGEIYAVVEAIDINVHRTKATKETGSRFQVGQMLFSPVSMNRAISSSLSQKGWGPKRIQIEVEGARGDVVHKGFREMDAVKNGLGLEVQFGKYAFMLYDILGKMPIFAKRGLIRAGVELVPTKEIAVGNMSSGVSYFEQAVADLQERGASDIDVPVLVLGIGFKEPPKTTLATVLLEEPSL